MLPCELDSTQPLTAAAAAAPAVTALLTSRLTRAPVNLACCASTAPASPHHSLGQAQTGNSADGLPGDSAARGGKAPSWSLRGAHCSSLGIAGLAAGLQGLVHRVHVAAHAAACAFQQVHALPQDACTGSWSAERNKSSW